MFCYIIQVMKLEQDRRKGEESRRTKRVDLRRWGLPAAAVLGAGLLVVPDIGCRVVGAVLTLDVARRVGFFRKRK